MDDDKEKEGDEAPDFALEDFGPVEGEELPHAGTKHESNNEDEVKNGDAAKESGEGEPLHFGLQRVARHRGE